MLHNYKNINGLVFDFCFHNENGACLLRLGLQRSLALTKPQRAAIYTAQVPLIKVCFPVYLSSGFSWAFCEQQRDAPVMDDNKTQAGTLNQQLSARPEPRVPICVLRQSSCVPPLCELWVGP